MRAKSSRKWLFFAQGRKHSSHHAAVERQDFIVSVTVRFHSQSIAELIFGVLAHQIDPDGVLTGHRLKLFCGDFRREPATMHPGDRLFKFLRRQVALAAGGEQFICLIELPIDERGLGEFDGTSRCGGLVMFHRLSAAVDQ